jgi:hypothetical protein
VPIYTRPVADEVICQVYELACTRFTLGAFRERWESFGWGLEDDGADVVGIRVWTGYDDPENEAGWKFWVDPCGSRVVCAGLPFCYWMDYDPEDHDDPADYKRELAAYNRRFEEVAAAAERLLPSPQFRWADADEHRHRAIVWTGSHGLLILQQASFDPQDGIEINFWLDPDRDFTPSTPLIDHLTRRSKAVHDRHDYPPLDWS